MIGFVVYEAIDLVYHAGKLGYNGLYGMYKWYYGISSENDVSEEEYKKRIEELENHIEGLESKYQKLENLVITEKNETQKN